MAGILTKLQDMFESLDWESIKEFCVKNSTTTALVFGVSLAACWLMFRKPRGIPPGPAFTLPIIGDVLSLQSSSDGDIRKPIRKLRRKYGDIFSVYIGQKLVIFINGYDAIKEALVKNGDLFSDRPRLFLNDEITQKKGISNSSGQLWKEQRKFALETLREFGFGRTLMEDKIREEIDRYVEVIGKQNGKPYDMLRLTQASISNVISSLVYGRRFDYNNPDFKDFLAKTEENFTALGATAIVNFIPFLRFLPGDLFLYKKTLRNILSVETKIVHASIREHEENYDENDTGDFISSYLKEMKKMEKNGVKSSFDHDNLVKSINDLFVAGTETTSTTILWTILYFIHHPEVQARCYKEVQDVVGSGRNSTLKDRDAMPYMQAVTMEILRIVNIVIIAAPHTVSEDTVFRGHFFPKDSVVMPNIDSVLQDEAVWGDPEVFRPERFLDSKGQVIKKEEYIPFSLGRRVCLGESLAKLELFMFLTTLVQRFEFRPVDPKNLPPLQGTFGLTHSPIKFEVRAVARI